MVDVLLADQVEEGFKDKISRHLYCKAEPTFSACFLSCACDLPEQAAALYKFDFEPSEPLFLM